MPSKLLMIGVVVMCGSFGAGCATMFTGSSQQVTVSSQPPGARVIVNGGYSGVTPVSLLLKTERDYTVTLQREGFQDTTAPIFREFNPVAVLNLVSLVCWVVDVATGALWRLTPTAVYVTLRPLGGPGAYPPPGSPWGPPPGFLPPGAPGAPPPLSTPSPYAPPPAGYYQPAPAPAPMTPAPGAH
jgi:hypothetical protein